MKLLSHVVTDDTGLAPNPFHGYCTSAVCTPSHRRAKLKEGDWLIGNSTNEDGNLLVYAMCISEVLSMNKYFRDERFASKKPKPNGEREEQCGDNIYYQDKDARWKRLPSRHHNDCEYFNRDVCKDRAGRPVFVSEHFYYFGDQRVAIPDKFPGIIHYRRSFHYTYDQLPHDFVTWLEETYEPGRRGKPRDMDMKDHSADTGTMITDLIADCAAQTKNQERGDSGPKSQSVTETQPRGRGCH